MDLKLPKQNSTRIFQMLINVMPYIFWKDINGIYQGGNWNQAVNFGFSSPTDFIGKTIFEILEDQEAAQQINEVDNKVMSDKKSLRVEQKIKIYDVEKVLFSQKQPIFNSNGDVIGLLGFSMDITEFEDRKNLLLREKDKIIDSMLEQINSMTSRIDDLIVEIKSYGNIPEIERNNLLNKAISIQETAIKI